MGLGSELLDFLQNYAWKFKSHPIRVNSARKSIGFFLKKGFNEIGPQSECLCPGGGIFHFLQLMEKAPPSNMVELWE